MALMHVDNRDMIRAGSRFDHCIICTQKEMSVPGALQGEDVFAFKFNGLSYCMCLDHFRELLGEYELIRKEELEELRNDANSKTT